MAFGIAMNAHGIDDAHPMSLLVESHCDQMTTEAGRL